MAIIGHGIDLVEVARVARMRGEHGQRFLERCFTPAERAYAAERKRTDEHLAGRFAAKEAVLKALGTGWRSGIGWTDVEVIVQPTGQPEVRLHARAAEVARQLGIARWWLSITHTQDHAAASALAES